MALSSGQTANNIIRGILLFVAFLAPPTRRGCNNDIYTNDLIKGNFFGSKS